MPTHNSVAKSVRTDKENHPERYCKFCLWRLLDRDGNYIGPCGKHGHAGDPTERRI